jgi:hypothetical protein
MSVQIETRHRFLLVTKEIWFAQFPHDVDGCSTVIFRQCRNRVDPPGFARTNFTTLIIDLTQPLDDIWRGMDSKSCRYTINRGLREGIEVALSTDYDGFRRLNRSFRERKGLDKTQLTLAQMKKHGTLFTATYSGQLQAAQLFIEDDDNIRYFIGASRRLEVDKRTAALIGFANRLLMWEAIQYAKKKKIKEFDMGGFYTGTNQTDPRVSINLFKKSFGGKVVTHYNYHKSYPITRHIFSMIGRRA